MNRIGLQGFAGDQAVSLYRYYRRLTTPAGQPVQYSASEIELLNSLRQGLPLRLHLASPTVPLFRAELARDLGFAPLADSGPSVIPTGAPLVVTGHSLGGHLALLFGRLFPSVTEHVYTYNAPGISLIGEGGLRWLGIGPIDAARVTNVAARMGSETVSRIWSKPGENIGVFTEAGSSLYQHSIVPLTDSLALYDAFATLSPGLSGNPAAVSGILSAASPYSEDSLEVVLDSLRTTLGAGGSPTLIARGLSDLAARDDYYQNLYALVDGRSPGRDYRIESLAGKTAGEIAAMAGADVSVRFALNELTPFAARNADFSSFEDSFSGQWLGSRAELLAAMLDGNLVDRVFGFSGTADNVLFSDIDSGLRYSKLDGIQGNLAIQISALADRGRIQQFLDSVPYNRSVVFGSDVPGGGDQLLGLSGSDRLFGAAGGDTLDGAGGDDYLEGGPGEDTLIGGAGDDTLNGGEGADRLQGGPGSDTYVFAAALDADTIVDRDGQIFAGEVLLTGGSGAQGGPYVSADGRFSYEFGGGLASEGTLVVNGALRVEGFRNGDLGIRLVDGIEPAEWLPVTDRDLLGDFNYVPFWASPTQFVGRDEYDNPLPATRAEAAPGRLDLDEEFPGTPGNTHFSMGGGNDLVQDLLGGDDRIELGVGDDAGFGGTGNDLLEGGPGRDLVAGGRGDDFLYAGSVDTAAADLDDLATATRSDGGDLLSGGDGDDTIVGDAEANLIEGGAGRDRIFGGAGDDWIGSDIAELAGREVYRGAFLNNDSPNRIVDYLWRHADPVTFSLQAGGGFASPGTARIGSKSLNVFYLDRVAGDADEIDAGSGNDTVAAGGGDDLIFGGAGDDFIDTGEGADTVFGGAGDDYILADWGAVGDYIDAGDGNDFVGSGAGDDVLMGGAGDDRLHSFGGNDILLGGEGRDFLSASGGSAVLDGGSGNDMLYARASPDGVSRVRVGRGSGVDVLEAWGGPLVVEIAGDVSPQEVSIARTQHAIPARDGPAGGLETLTGIMVSIGADGDALFLADLQPANLQAARSVEFADGTVWDEAYLQSLLAPGGLPDSTPTLNGTPAGELIYGTAGAEILSGSQGDDWLTGDAGDDVYLYAQGDGFDVIEDTDHAPGNMDVLRFGSGILAQQVDVFATGGDYILAAGAGGVRIRGGRAPDGAIERIEFADGTRWSGVDLEARAEVLPDNRAPEMPALLGSVAVEPGSPVEITIPRDAISDPDRFDSLGFYAISADGERLPDWLHFDPSSLTVSGTPAAADAGPHELLLIAVDSNGAAAYGGLAISVGGEAAAPQDDAAPQPAASPISQPAIRPAPATEAVAAIDVPATQIVPTPARREGAVFEAAPVLLPIGDSPNAGDSAEPVFRDIQHRFDVLLQTGRTNLGERYTEAVREFEERRLQREETSPPPQTDEEVEAWNSAMHNWHERNPGFSETDLGGNDGTWTMGWGLPGPGNLLLDGAATAPGLTTPGALPRLRGVGAAPALGEGLKELR